MAEKFKIFEAEIDVDKAISDTKALKEQVAMLKEQTKNAKETQGEFSEEYIRYEAQLKVVQKELRQQQTLTQNVTKAQKDQSGSLSSVKAQLAIVTNEWNELSESERLNGQRGKELTAVKLKLTNQLKAEEKATGDTRRNVGNYEEGMKGAIASTSQFIPGAGKAATASKSLGLAFKVMLGPIGIIIAAVGLVIAAFKSFFASSEEGENKLASLKAVFSGVFDTFTRVLNKVAETIIWAFTEPQKAIASLWEAIKTNIINRFTGFIDQFKALGKVIRGVFDLDWDLVKEGAADFGEAMIQTLTGVDNLIGKVKNALNDLVEEQTAKAKALAALAARQAQYDIDERARIVEAAKLQRDINLIREKASQKEKYDAAERLKLMDEAIALQNELEESELKSIRTKYELKKANNAITLSLKADKEEEARLLADLITAEGAAALSRRKLEKERQVAIKEIAAEKAAIAKAEFDQMLLLMDEMEAEIEADKKRKLDALKLNYDNELALLGDNLFAKLEFERNHLDAELEQELAYAELIGADKELINEKYNQRAVELAQIKMDAELDIASNMAGGLAQIFGEQTALGKAAAVVATSINTYKGAMAAFADTPGGVIIKSAAAAIAVGVGLKSIQKILQVNTKVSKSAGGSSTPSRSIFSGAQGVSPNLGSSIATQGVGNSAGQMAYSAISRNAKPSQILVVDNVTAKQTDMDRIKADNEF